MALRGEENVLKELLASLAPGEYRSSIFADPTSYVVCESCNLGYCWALKAGSCPVNPSRDKQGLREGPEDNFCRGNGLDTGRR